MELNDAVAHFDADPDVWVPVPLGFPSEPWSTPQAWAAQAVADLAPFWRLDDLQRADLEHMALVVASSPTPLPDPVARFWHLPVEPGVSRVVHAYAETLEPGWRERIEEWATDGYDGALFQRAEPRESATYGTLVCTSALWPIPGSTGAAAVLRVIGAIADMIVVIEIIDGDIGIAARLLEPAVGLAESLRLGPAA
ncbi:hypothetical protein [Agrococcus sp. HG114]|uniref:hypothetical protein n=1 Tax=Agrococcus sp. HG114 TaxID=2969757 RepID=UPI00215A10AD|nr:hypothetical protein [Agrococcus sp. HG114]MCR8670079.1 hypothetical protein [Agrococcus sp. HG114]